VYKYLSNKGIRSANSLDVSQDVIKNQHKNKAKTKPNCEMTKMNVNSIISNNYGKNQAFCQNKNKANTKPNF